ncbi:MAG: DMT family transporter [Pseudomonadota bacterium]
MSDHLKGLLMTLVAIFAMSPDSLIIRMVDADQSTIVFWRSFLVFEGLLVLTTFKYGRNSPTAFRAIGKPGLLLAVMWATSSLLFVSALMHTSVGNTLVILSTAPIFAALITWVLTRERTGRHTVLTIVVVIGAVILIVLESYQSGRLAGDLFALGAAISVALGLVVVRRQRHTDMTPALSLSGLLLAAVVLPFASPFDIDHRTAALFLLLALLMTIAVGLFYAAPRYIPAAEVSLMLPLETVIGTFIVWLLLGERPADTTIVGGAVVILALVVHAGISLRVDRKATAKSPTV